MPRKVDDRRRDGESEEEFAARVRRAAVERTRKARQRAALKGGGTIVRDNAAPLSRVVPASGASVRRGGDASEVPSLYGVPVGSVIVPAIVPSVVRRREGGRGVGQSQEIKSLGIVPPPPLPLAREEGQDNEQDNVEGKWGYGALTPQEQVITSHVVAWLERELPSMIRAQVAALHRAKAPTLSDEQGGDDSPDQGVLGDAGGADNGQDNPWDNVHVGERDKALVVPSGGPEPDPMASSNDADVAVSDALAAAWVLAMWEANAIPVEGIIRPLGLPELIALEEVFRAASSVALPEDGFAFFEAWTKAYASDSSIRASEKTPVHFAGRFASYIGGAPPARDAGAAARRVAAWQALTGESIRLIAPAVGGDP